MPNPLVFHSDQFAASPSADRLRQMINGSVHAGQAESFLIVHDPDDGQDPVPHFGGEVGLHEIAKQRLPVEGIHRQELVSRDYADEAVYFLQPHFGGRGKPRGQDFFTLRTSEGFTLAIASSPSGASIRSRQVSRAFVGSDANHDLNFAGLFASQFGGK